MRLPHLFHSDPDWKIVGANRYDECRRCGARRTMQYVSTLMSPVLPGWPDLVDRHGQLLANSGWCK